MLRPEGTTGVIRAFLNAGLTQDIPKRFSYYGPMFRYERPQKGRLRQFHQFGVEALGSENPEQDAEIISMAYNILQMLGIDNLDLVINSVGSSETKQKYSKILKDYLSDHINQLSDISKDRYNKKLELLF